MFLFWLEFVLGIVVFVLVVEFVYVDERMCMFGELLLIFFWCFG